MKQILPIILFLGLGLATAQHLCGRTHYDHVAIDCAVPMPMPVTAELMVGCCPPEEIEEIRPRMPCGDYVWIQGCWRWEGRWIWAPGFWMLRPYRDAVWIPGCWTPRHDHWVWTEGRWR